MGSVVNKVCDKKTIRTEKTGRNQIFAETFEKRVMSKL